MVGPGEAGDPFGYGGDQDAVVGLAGTDAQADCQAGLPVPDRRRQTAASSRGAAV